MVTAETEDGKLTVEHIQRLVEGHIDEHMVKPKLVYISDSTEVGTIYYKEELEAISSYCRANGLLLFIDGARLGSALMAEDNDVTLNDLARLADAFYIGGTKNGALMGEALVIINESLKSDFRYLIKQRGGLLAKGRLLAINFIELFKENLFFELADHANQMAGQLKEGIEVAGYCFLTDSTTNQIFPIFPNEIIEAVRAEYDFSVWEKIDENHTAIRLVTSWATKAEEVKAFNKRLLELK